jgi:four helix bundle protein
VFFPEWGHNCTITLWDCTPNIAEGCGLGTEAQLAHYMQISMGSASELEYQLLLAHDLEYLSDDNYQKLNDAVIEVKRMLAPFIKRLQPTR